MARRYQPRLDLEKLIPQSILNNVQRECPYLECRSKDIVMRYFNNTKNDQPRFYCNECKSFFTLGGKLRNPYKKAKNRIEKATTRTKVDNLEAKGSEIGENSGLVRWIQTKTRSSRRGLSQATDSVVNGIDTRGKSQDIEVEEEFDNWEKIEEIESEHEDDGGDGDEGEDKNEYEYEDEDEGGHEDEGEDEDENEDKDGEWFPVDLNESLHQGKKLPKGDEEMHQAEETKELADSSLLREGNENCIPTDKVLESMEETPMVLDTTLREELLSSMLSKTELLRLKALKHLLKAQTTLEEVFIEKSIMEMELECKEIEQRCELEKRDLYPSEEMLNTFKEGIVKHLSSWLVDPLNGARIEMLAPREASLKKVGETVENLAVEVRDMENTFVPHARMVRIEKKAKRLWDRVVALTN